MLNLVKTKNKGFLKILKRVKNINWFYVIVLTFLVAYVSHLILKYHFVLWDEAVYIGIGKYLFSSGQVGLWEEIRPLGIPLLFGGAWKLGLNPVIAGRVIELLFSIGTISLVYLISKEIFNKKIASINIVIYVITPLFFYNSLRLMTGVPSTFFVLLATYFFIKKQLFWAGLGAALAFIFRYPQGLIVLICLLTLLLEFLLSKEQFKQPKQLKIRIKRLIKDFTYFLSGFLPLIIVLFIFNYYKYGSALYPFISAFSHGGNLVHAVESKITGLFFYLIALLQHNLLLCLGVLGFVIAIWQIIRKKPINKTYNKLIIIVLSIILFYSYLTIIVNKQARFGIVIIPFLAILSGYGLNQVLELIFSQTNKKTANHNITIKQTWLKILPIALLIIFIIYSFGSSMYMNYQKYNSFPAEKPVIVDEYYNFFPDNFEGVILTADPVHVAYTDIKMIPYYFSTIEASPIYDKWISKKDTSELKEQVTAIVFIPGPFVCFDNDCRDKLKPELFSKIKENPNNKLVFEKKYEEVKSIYYVE